MEKNICSITYNEIKLDNLTDIDDEVNTLNEVYSAFDVFSHESGKIEKRKVDFIKCYKIIRLISNNFPIDRIADHLKESVDNIKKIMVSMDYKVGYLHSCKNIYEIFLLKRYSNKDYETYATSSYNNDLMYKYINFNGWPKKKLYDLLNDDINKKYNIVKGLIFSENKYLQTAGCWLLDEYVNPDSYSKKKEEIQIYYLEKVTDYIKRLFDLVIESNLVKKVQRKGNSQVDMWLSAQQINTQYQVRVDRAIEIVLIHIRDKHRKWTDTYDTIIRHILTSYRINGDLDAYSEIINLIEKKGTLETKDIELLIKKYNLI